ncbi:uncharacterized protein LOC131008125 [Salvia miltiorrhiza]|uniref:uncharacterized protein LOC131008125 n=1 Tax=Salvia miltiorrhiza TaxID=226208 RepID=UPI0025ABFD6E|nr:uncharacterized protein LOC131008125 [Salvia miltiorrhiza]
MDHLIWYCPIARHAWLSLLTWFHLEEPLISDVGSLVISAMQIRASRQLTNLWWVGFISTIWCIWNHRNQVIFEDAASSATSITIQVKTFILEASRLCPGPMANTVDELLVLHGLGVPGKPRSSVSYIYVLWRAPPAPWLKFNIDGSVHGAPPCIHAGGIIRSWAFDAELLALIIALERIVHHGWYYVWIESDSSYVVNHFRSRSLTVPWRFLNQWKKSLQDSSHLHICISHIYREGNAVADFLASLVVEKGFWPSVVPGISSLVRDDVCSLPYVRIVQ